MLKDVEAWLVYDPQPRQRGLSNVTVVKQRKGNSWYSSGEPEKLVRVDPMKRTQFSVSVCTIL